MRPFAKEARWTFWTTLTSGQREELTDVPGVWLEPAGANGHGYTDVLKAPWNATDWLWGALKAWNARTGIVGPREPVETAPTWSVDAEAALLDSLYCNGIRRGIVTADGSAPFSAAPFQLETVNWMHGYGGGVAKLEPGGGKTIIALMLAVLAEAGPVLITTESGVLFQYRYWIDRLVEGGLGTEIRPPSRAPVVKGERLTSEQQVDRALARASRLRRRPILVVGWDSLDAHIDVLAKVPFSAVVWDEAQKGKQAKREKWRRDPNNPDGPPLGKFTSHRAALAYRLTQGIPRRYATTATPIFDRRGDLYGICTLVDPWGWGRTATKYHKRYQGAYEGQHGLVIEGETRSDELDARLAKVIWKIPREVSHAGLPPTTLDVVAIPVERLDPPPANFKQNVVVRGRAAAQGDLEARAQLREELIQVAAARKGTPVLEDVEAFLADVPKRGLGKVVLFTGRHLACVDMARRCEDRFRGIAETLWGIKPDGNVPSLRRRHEMQMRYMDHPGPAILVGTGQAWGVGRDLQDTDLACILYIPPPGDYIQWCGRFARLGQRRPCRIVTYTAMGTADMHMASIFADKAKDLVRLMDQREFTGLGYKLKGVMSLGEGLADIAARSRAAWAEDWVIASEDGRG